MYISALVQASGVLGASLLPPNVVRFAPAPLALFDHMLYD
jgi:hypothetical protein